MVYKWCVVPQCSNTSIRSPRKLFISVPINPKKRKRWLQLAQRDPNDIATQSHVYMCEDHFDIEKDIVNYMKFKEGYSQRLLLGDEAVPSKFLCQDNFKRLMLDAGTFGEVFKTRKRMSIKNCEDENHPLTQNIDETIQRHDNYLLQKTIDEETEGYSSGEDLSSMLPHQAVCMCCLSQQEPFIKISTCNHLSFFECLFKFKMEISNILVCLQCHNMLKKIENFKDQVQQCIQILSNQLIDVKPDFVPKLQLSEIIAVIIEPSLIDDTKEIKVDQELDVSINKEEITCEETEIKIENDFSDEEINMTLCEVKKEIEDCGIEKINKKITKRKEIVETGKCEGKFLTVTLSMKALLEEREVQKMDEKYLKLHYKCEDCIVGFKSKTAFNSHIYKLHNNKNNSFTCDICKSVLRSSYFLKKHVKRHMRRFDCSSCVNRYRYESSAVQHYNKNHGIHISRVPMQGL